MKKVFIVLIILLLTLTMISCKTNDKENNSATNIINNVEIDLPVEEELEELEDEDLELKMFSKLTGLEITEGQSKIRPVVVMLDNQFKARPQAGLSDADVVYEILAEGTITRYMAVFQTNQSDVVGPVRSSRPYYIERALEYNPLYVHVGGSMQALSDIKSYKMGDIDGMSVGAGVFYRTTHKKMPHNAYSSTEGIRNEGIRKKLDTEVEFAGMPISNKKYDLNGSSAQNVLIQYKKPTNTDSVGYFVSFKYDSEEKNYLRYVNGEEHLDEETKIHLRADNIIIQNVAHKVIDDAGRLELNMISNGVGYYVNKGVYVDITWEKTGEFEQTKYYLKDGTELILNPGITWIQVIPTNVVPNIE